MNAAPLASPRLLHFNDGSFVSCFLVPAFSLCYQACNRLGGSYRRPLSHFRFLRRMHVRSFEDGDEEDEWNLFFVKENTQRTLSRKRGFLGWIGLESCFTRVPVELQSHLHTEAAKTSQARNSHTTFDNSTDEIEYHPLSSSRCFSPPILSRDGHQRRRKRMRRRRRQWIHGFTH